MPQVSETSEIEAGTAGKDATYDRILETIDRLFYRHGIRSIGVDAIVNELGISKKTLYRHFRSKNEMIEAYLRGRYRPLPISDKPPVEQILANFRWLERSLASKQEFRGCVYLNAIAELGERDSELRDLAVELKESRRLWFRELLSRLDIDDPDALATQLALLIDGAYAAVLVTGDPAMARPATAAARILLKNAGLKVGLTGADEGGGAAPTRRASS